MMIKIYVDTEEEKQQILNESEYIHYFAEIISYINKQGIIKQRVIALDTDKASILTGIYTIPEMIVVRK